MNTTRLLGSFCAAILASSLGTLAACGGHDSSKDAASTASVVNAASVSIALTGAEGADVGHGSGVLLAPNAVLTAAHLISGKSSWVITSADGKTKVTAHRAMTYDWLTYDSNLAHPRRHDVGVIYLDSPINLAAYPSIVSSKAEAGALATRLRGTGAGFEAHGVALESLQGAPNSYLSAWGLGETLDTGGAVFTEAGLIGVVSGVGTTTNKLYIARTDGLAAWLAPKIACAGGALGTRAYAPPAPKAADCDAGPGSGTDNAGSSGGGSSSGGSSSGGPGSSSGGPGGNNCADDHNGNCSGDACGSGGIDNANNPGGGANPGGSSSGGAGSTSGNPGSTSGGTPANTGGIDTSNNPGSSSGTPGASSGTPGASSSSGSTSGNTNTGGIDTSNNPGGSPGGSTSGAPGSSTSGGPDSSQNPGSNSPGGGASAVPGGNEACTGDSDNPDVCPPEAGNCSGPTCGGGQPDNWMDFGSCGCAGSVAPIHLN